MSLFYFETNPSSGVPPLVAFYCVLEHSVTTTARLWITVHYYRTLSKFFDYYRLLWNWVWHIPMVEVTCVVVWSSPRRQNSFPRSFTQPYIYVTQYLIPALLIYHTSSLGYAFSQRQCVYKMLRISIIFIRNKKHTCDNFRIINNKEKVKLALKYTIKDQKKRRYIDLLLL